MGRRPSAIVLPFMLINSELWELSKDGMWRGEPDGGAAYWQIST